MATADISIDEVAIHYNSYLLLILLSMKLLFAAGILY